MFILYHHSGWKSLATDKAGAPRELDGPTSVLPQWGPIATARHMSHNLVLLLGRRDHSGYQRLLSEMTLQVSHSQLQLLISYIIYILPHNYHNIAKGTTDPRVEFILPKSYCKFKHKS